MRGLLFILMILNIQSAAQYSDNSLEFIENRGQILDMEGNLRADILYVGDGGGAKIYLRQGAISYVLTMDNEEEEELETLNTKHETLRGHRVDMEFVNANMDAKTRVEEPTQGYFNYYLGHCPEGITEVKAHRKVIYENVYPNIDVVFYGGINQQPATSNQQPATRMEYDFVVKPGGNVEDIILRYKGAERIEIKEGKLHIKTSLDEIKEEIPEVYQIIEGERVKVKAAYVLEGNEVNIKVGNYDRSKSLIIDPWITYYGGGGLDWGLVTATDGSGNVMITGKTGSIDFPVTPGAFQTSYGGGTWDAFVVKLDAAGNRLWATYYGGSAWDQGAGIATDGSDNVLITGYTASTDFPVSVGAFQTNNAGGPFGHDAFVVKFDAAGNRLWATYYGGSDDENFSTVCGGIATDGNDNVLITGKTGSIDFPVSPGAFQTSYGGGALDAFVVKFDSAGNQLWATYYGGSTWDDGYGIVTDGNDNVVISGRTASPDFPFTAGAFQTSPGGGGFYDAFVVKLDAGGNQLWATYYGGSDWDQGDGIATDGSGNVVITGLTKSTDFPVTAGAFQTSYGGGAAVGGDAFVVKLDPAGNQLWATYLGGSDREEGFGIAVDGSDNIFVCGDTYSTDFPIIPGSFQTANGGAPGDEDNYMVKFDPDGNLVCGTYLGGSGHDEMYVCGNIAVYGGVVYMTGMAEDNYPVTAGAFQTVLGGGNWDAWIAQLCDDCTMNCSISMTVNASALPDTICQDSCTNLNASAAFGTGTYTYGWTSIPPGFTSSAQNPKVCPDITTTYIVTVDDGDTTATASVKVSVIDCDTTERIFFIPNSFSPNKDGENDTLLVRGSGIKNIKLFIYNRWGEKVFESRPDNSVGTATEGWDGTYKGRKLNTGVFAWYAEVEFEDGDRIYRKGNVTLVR